MPNNNNKKKKPHDDLHNAAIGFASGLAVAAGGGYKDAPYEGFDSIKFFRSPIIGTAAGVVVGRILTREPLILFLVVIAIERMIVEAYKVGRATMPGKFRVGEWGKEKCCSCLIS